MEDQTNFHAKSWIKEETIVYKPRPIKDARWDVGTHVQGRIKQENQKGHMQREKDT